MTSRQTLLLATHSYCVASHRWDFEQSDLLLYVTQPTVEHFTISRRYCDTEGAF